MICRLSIAIVLIALFAFTGMVHAQLDVAELDAAYRAYDLGINEGMGRSDSANSGTLGWAESRHINNYAAMWEVTGDIYWLQKIADHFQRIMGNATDPDGDGYLSWQTTGYSTALAFSERLHNVSDATITPERQKIMKGAEAAKATGHTYIIQFTESADAFDIIDADTHEAVAEAQAYTGGEAITGIEPFTFTIEGEAHQGDRFHIRTIAPIPAEFVVHQGMFIYPVAQFIEAVKTTPQLQEEFGELADTFLDFINTHLFEKNDRYWLQMGPDSGAYQVEPKITARYPNRVLPHNQYLALARAWLVLKDLEGAHPDMARRARQMAQFFKDNLVLNEDANAWRWSYWDYVEYGEPNRSRWEDTSHGHIDVSFAVEAARRGVVFTDEDMQRFANTWLEVMWNGDEDNPRMASRVDGTEPYRHPALLVSWSELSQWDSRVYDLALTEFQSKDAEEQAQWAPAMLRCVKRAGIELTGE